MARNRLMAAALVALVAMMCVGCEDTVPTPAEREAVESRVTAYLHALAEAYSSLNISALEEHASAPEIQEVRKVLRGLAGTGDRVEAKLLSVDFTSLDVFREVNATVTLTEVWDVTRFDAFDGREKDRNPTSIQDSIIQLRLTEDRWRVTARRVLGQEAGPRWRVETPAPEAGETS